MTHNDMLNYIMLLAYYTVKKKGKNFHPIVKLYSRSYLVIL